jgi:hypothetical protein
MALSKRKSALAILIPSLLVIAIMFTKIVHAQSLTLTLTTDKLAYSLGEIVQINGTLSSGDTAITDGLVAIQVNTPYEDPLLETLLVRTRPTGTNITRNWILEITSISTVGGSGEQANEFPRGTMVGFNVTIKNNQPSTYDAYLIISAFYPNEIPFYSNNDTHMIPYGVKLMWYGSIDPNEEITVTASSLIFIPRDAPLGTATAYANLLTEWPANGGYAYCPEKSVTFQITSETGGSSQTSSQTFETQSQEGSYNLTFTLPESYAKLGNYTVYASAFYEISPYRVQASTTFEVILRGDITGFEGVPDGKCDILDVATVAAAFGSYPGHPRWNPIADLDDNGKVEILDVAMVTVDYGKIAFP